MSDENPSNGHINGHDLSGSAPAAANDIEWANRTITGLWCDVLNDLRVAYGEQFMSAAVVLLREDVVGFRGLQDRLKARGCRRDDYERKCREYVRQQAAARQQSNISASHGPITDKATILLNIVRQSGCKLFHHDEETYCSISVGGHIETYDLRSRKFRHWLAAQSLAQQGTAPSNAVIGTALNTLSGVAMFQNAEQRTYLRLAEDHARVFLDLCSDSWRVVQIDPSGWSVIDASQCPVVFRRARGMEALPEPQRGGSIEMLRQFTNLRDESDFRLFTATMLAALRPGRPFPVLFFCGGGGSAKSWMQRVWRLLLDPNKADIRSQPREARDLVVAANAGHCICLNNISNLSAWVSDLLCCLSTGNAFSTRAMRTDADEVLFSAIRPISINSIEECIKRQDLRSRSIFLYVPAIADDGYLPERTYMPKFEELRPFILGALLTGVAEGLRNLPTIKIAGLPRMADFIEFVEACAPAFGWTAGSLLQAFKANQQLATAAVLESPLALAMQRLPFAHWEGTASDLLSLLSNLLVGDEERYRKALPADGERLSNQLRRVAADLKRVGIDILFDPHRRTHAGRRMIYIERKTPPNAPKQEPGSLDLYLPGLVADDTPDDD